MRYSVILPVYNGTKYIERAIDSVLTQSFDDYELIVIDDGSTDNTLQLLKSTYQNNEHVKIVHQSNQGPLVARANGIENASGEYLLFLDADDWYVDNSLQIINQALIRYNNPDCLYFGFQRVNDNESVLDIVTETSESYHTNQRDIIKYYTDNDSAGSLSRKTIKKSVYVPLDYSKYKYLRTGEDCIQSFELLKQCETVAYITDVLYCYYQNNVSTMNTVTYDNYKVDYTFTEEVIDYIKDVFSQEDMEEYRIGAIRGICFDCRRIGGFKVPQKLKNELFYQKQNHWVYRDFLMKNGGRVKTGFWLNDIIWWLYRNKRFKLITIVTRILEIRWKLIYR